MSNPLHPLEYAQRRPPWHRRRIVRRAVLGLLLLSGVVALTIVGRAVWQQWRWNQQWQEMLASQQRCMSYVVTSDFAPCDNDPAAGRFLEYIPVEFHTFNEAALRLDQIGWGLRGVAFLHGRRPASGMVRLVIVWADWNDEERGVNLVGDSVVPATSNQGPHLAANTRFGVLNCDRRVESLTIYGGEPDQTDSSHFTIGYRLNGQPGTIDGRLLDSGKVKMHVRNGPATFTTTAPRRHSTSEPSAN